MLEFTSFLDHLANFCFENFVLIVKTLLLIKFFDDLFKVISIDETKFVNVEIEVFRKFFELQVNVIRNVEVLDRLK